MSDTPEPSREARLTQIRARLEGRATIAGWYARDVSWLLDQLAARDAQLQQIREAVRRIADYPDAEMFLSLAPAVEMKRLARLALLSEEP